MQKRSSLRVLAAVMSIVMIAASIVAFSGATDITIDTNTRTANMVTVSAPANYISLVDWNGDFNLQTSYKEVGSLTEGSYARVTQSGGAVTIQEIVVRGSDSVTVETTIANGITLNDGALTLSTANKVTGSSQTAANKTLNANVAGVTVQGLFSSIGGSSPVTLSGTLTLNGGTPTLSASSTNYDLNIDGASPTISGTFGNLSVNSGSATVSDNTTLSTIYIADNTSVILAANKTLKVGVTDSVTATNSGSLTFGGATPWGTLSAGTYQSVTGSWEQSGAVTILSTKNLPAETANITTNGNNLTADGSTTKIALLDNPGNLTVQNDARVTVGQSVTATGINVQTGGVIELNSATAPSYFTLSDGSKSITNISETEKLNLATWGEIPLVGTSTIYRTLGTTGEWTLPTGAYVALATSDETMITGDGGELKVLSNNISVDGEFNKLTIDDGNGSNPIFATVAGDTVLVNAIVIGADDSITVEEDVSLCDPSKSIIPAADATISTWGKLPTGSYNLTGSWCGEENANVTITKTTSTCTSGHSHVQEVTITSYKGNLYVSGDVSDTKVIVNGTIDGVIYLTGGNLSAGSNTVINTGGIVTGTATGSTGGTKVNADPGETKLIQGSFSTVTGESILLAGDTVIYSTKNADSSKGEAVITGNGFGLTVYDMDSAVELKGSFAFVNLVKSDSDNSVFHATLGEDTTINGGTFGISGEEVPDGTLLNGLAPYAIHTLTIGEADPSGQPTVACIEGGFQQVNVTGGIVTDCNYDDCDLHGDKKLYLYNSTTALNVTGGDVHLNNGGIIYSNADVSSGVNAISVSGGTLTIGYDGAEERTEDLLYTIRVDNNQGVNRAIYVIGSGRLNFYDGKAYSAGQTGSSVVYVSGTGATAHIGIEANTYAFDSAHTPYIRTNSNGNYGVYITNGAEVWVRAGEIDTPDEGTYGIYVTSSGGFGGTCHIHPNDQYGVYDEITSPLLYVHGGYDAKAAMQVESDALFDIRGRGALFEEGGHATDSQYALFIHANAVAASEYPLSGGTFNGKVRYPQNTIHGLLAHNHYLRYDGSAANFSSSDGSYGVRPEAMTSDVESYGSATTYPERAAFYAGKDVMARDGAYTFEFGRLGEFYTIADAEWELRTRMNAGEDYQIPTGIVRSGETNNLITLDVNIFDTNAGEYRPYWGMGKKQGDVEVTGSSALYLAGRTLRYTGVNYEGALLSDTVTSGASLDYKAADDWKTVLDIKSGGTLAIIDAVVDTDGQALPAEAADKFDGHYIGSGLVSYQWVDEGDTTTAHSTKNVKTYVINTNSGATLNLVSAQIQAIGSKDAAGIMTSGTTNIGMGAAWDVFDDSDFDYETNDNQLIDIHGGLNGGSPRAVYQTAGVTTLNGGVVGNLIDNSLYGGNVAIETVGGTLYIKGGMVVGNNKGADGAIWNNGGTTYVTGGAIYGDWGNDSGTGNGNSLRVTAGTLYLQIDATHSANGYTTANAAGYTEQMIPLTGDGAYKTSDLHHINNIQVDGGNFYMGVQADYDAPAHVTPKEITGYSRNNGTLTAIAGKTVVYDGITIGDTTVYGAEVTGTASPFTTQFYVDGGNFGNLYVKNYDDAAVNNGLNNGKGYYQIRTIAAGQNGDASYGSLSNSVQLHGGVFKSIDLSGLTTRSTGSLGLATGTIGDIAGSWKNNADPNDDGIYEWVSYNHYATLDGVTRNTTGYWSSGAHYSVNLTTDGRYVGALDKAGEQAAANADARTAIVIHDGVEEFVNWMESDASAYDGVNGANFILRANIWLGDEDDTVCTGYFHCYNRAVPTVTVGAGVHNLNLNGLAVMGEYNGTLIEVPANATLNVTSTFEQDYEDVNYRFISQALMRNFMKAETDTNNRMINNLGTLTLTSKEGEHRITVKGYGAAVETGGTMTATNVVLATTTLGDKTTAYCNGSAANSDAILVSAGTLTLDQAVVSGTANGVEAGAGNIIVKNQSMVRGENLNGIAYAVGTGSISVADSTVFGNTNGISYYGIGNITTTGKWDAEQGRFTTHVFGATADAVVFGGTGNVTVTNAEITGNKNGIAFDGTGKVAVTGTTAAPAFVLGQTENGIDAGASCTGVEIQHAAVIAPAGTGIAFAGTGNLTISNGRVVGGQYGINYTGTGAVNVTGTRDNKAIITAIDEIAGSFGTNTTGLTMDYVTVEGASIGIFRVGSGTTKLSNAEVIAHDGYAKGIRFGGSQTATLSNVTVTMNGENATGIEVNDTAKVTLASAVNVSAIRTNSDAALVNSGTLIINDTSKSSSLVADGCGIIQSGLTSVVEVYGMPLIKGNTRGFYKSNSGIYADKSTKLEGGVYSSIVTLGAVNVYGNPDDPTVVTGSRPEVLADFISAKISDNADEVNRALKNGETDAEKSAEVPQALVKSTRYLDASTYSYTVTVDNPAFDSSQPEDPNDNPKTIEVTRSYTGRIPYIISGTYYNPGGNVNPGGGGGGGGVSEYDVNVGTVNGGKVISSHEKAKENEEITLTVTVDDELYTFLGVTVTDADGNEVKLTDKGNGIYTFAMPASDVKVTVNTKATHECYDYVDHDSWKDWAEENICFVIENGMMGSTETSRKYFNSLQETDRGMMVTVLYRLSGAPGITAEDLAAYDNAFVDVKKGDWFYDAVVWAYVNGVTTGTSDTTFEPALVLGRDQMITFLFRYADFMGLDVSDRAELTDYEDVSLVAGWAFEAYQWAVSKEIILGTADQGLVLSPAVVATREQFATVIARFMKNYMDDIDWVEIYGK